MVEIRTCEIEGCGVAFTCHPRSKKKYCEKHKYTNRDARLKDHYPREHIFIELAHRHFFEPISKLVSNRDIVGKTYIREELKERYPEIFSGIPRGTMHNCMNATMKELGFKAAGGKNRNNWYERVKVDG